MKLKKYLGLDTAGEEIEIKALNDKYHTGEMDEYTDAYVSIVLEKLNAAREHTADARLMGVIDFKYGKGVRVSAERNERMYRAWAEKGYLTLTPGDVIDYRAIVEYVLYLSKKAHVVNIGYDPWKSLEVVNMLGTVGNKYALRGVRQTYGNFTAPVESFEHGVKTGRIHINDNPINFYCFGNAVLDYDNLENCKPVKRKHTQKIDGVITMLMCLRLFIDGMQQG